MIISDKIKKIRLSEIKPYEKNAKIHSEHQIDLLKESLQNNDYYNPISIDGNGVIVTGHGRFYAISALKPLDEEIEVVDLSYLSEEKIKKLRILDNKISSNFYDTELLMEEIKEIEASFSGDILQLEREIAMEIFKSNNSNLKMSIPEDNIPSQPSEAKETKVNFMYVNVKCPSDKYDDVFDKVQKFIDKNYDDVEVI